MNAEVQQLLRDVLSQIESNFVSTFDYEQGLSVYDYMMKRYDHTEYNALLGDIVHDLQNLTKLRTSPTEPPPAPLYFVVEGGAKETVNLNYFISLNENLFQDESLALFKFERPVDFVEVYNFVNIVHANVKFRAVLSHISELGTSFTRPNLERDLGDISQNKFGLFYKLKEIDQSLKKRLPAVEEDLDDFLRSLDTTPQPVRTPTPQPKPVPTMDSDDDLDQFLDSISDTTLSTYNPPTTAAPPDSTRYYYENTGEGEGKCFVISTPVREIYPNMFASDMDCNFAKDLMPKLVNVTDCIRFKNFESEQRSTLEVNDLNNINTKFKTYEFFDVENPKGVEGMHVSAILSLLGIFHPDIQNEFKTKALTLKIGNDADAMKTYLQKLSAILKTQLYVWNYELKFETLLMTKYFTDRITSSKELVNMPLCLFQLEGEESNVQAVIPLVPVTLFTPF